MVWFVVTQLIAYLWYCIMLIQKSGAYRPLKVNNFVSTLAGAQFRSSRSNIMTCIGLTVLGWAGAKWVWWGQSKALEIFREPMVIRSTYLFSHWNRESKTDDPVIISSLAFNSGTKISSDSLCPTIHSFCFTLPYWELCGSRQGIGGGGREQRQSSQCLIILVE